jgi:hypothetical protein
VYVCTTSPANAFQRRFGSVPTRTMTSCGAPPRRAAVNSLAGQVIRRVTPSTSSTSGRVAWKSKNVSGSIVASAAPDQTRSRCCAAYDAASPASFHPRNAATITGRFSSGSSWYESALGSAIARQATAKPQ